MEACEGCGFVWELVPDDEVAARVIDGAERAAALVRGGGTAADQRPEPHVWSPLEYAAHVRDVLLHVRDRFVIGLVEDNPSFKPLYRDQRVDFGLYVDDTPEVVAAELEMAAALFARTYGRLDGDQLDRPCQYAFPNLQTRSLRWMGQQAVHEVEHHLADIERPLP